MGNRNCWIKKYKEAVQSHLNRVIENTSSELSHEGSADTLYHYTSIENAAKILSSSTLRHGLSARLNDPWDCKIKVHVAFEYENLLEEIKKVLESVLKGEKILCESLWIESCTHPYAPVQHRIADWTRGQGDKIEVEKLPGGQTRIKCIDGPYLQAIIQECMAEMKERKCLWIKSKDKFKSYIYASIQANLFCLSERIDHMLMWSHYAKSHRGVAIGFHRRDDAENLLRLARPVKYSSDLPELHASDEANRITSSYPLLPDDIVRECLFLKSVNWEYEKEWRLLLPFDGNNQCMTVLRRDDIKSIHLGCRCSYDDVCQIIDVADRHWPNADIYIMKTSEKEYGLDEEKIRCRNSANPGLNAPNVTQVKTNIDAVKKIFLSPASDDSIVVKACLYVEKSLSKIDDNHRLVNQFRICVRKSMLERSKMPAGSEVDPKILDPLFRPLEELIPKH